jgi:cell division protein FtsW
MREQFVPERLDTRPADTLLLSLLILLVGMGLGVLFSASYHRALVVFKDPYYFIRKQILWVALGTAAAFVMSRLSLNFLKRVTPFLVVSTILLMALCFVPGISPRIMGARRWIFIFGISFQPSEMAKIAVILYLAFILNKKQEKLDDPLNSLLPPLIITVVFAGLTYLQNDFSTAVFLLLLGLSLFFIAEVKVRYIFLMLTATLPVSLFLLFSKEHRVQRLLTFLEPGRDPVGADYQILAARNALLKGGFWGSGIGQGTRKLGGLPEAHSDFVFAVLAEELGFLGVFLVILLFLAFAYRGYSIAFQCEDRYGYFLAFGATTCIVFQALLNMAVVSGLVPATGIPLPFFSSGGSSVLAALTLCGLLVNLSRRTPPRNGVLYG